MEENVENNLWGVNYFKNGKPRRKTKRVPLKDLTTDHIKNILIFFENRTHQLNPSYLKYFNLRVQ